MTEGALPVEVDIHFIRQLRREKKYEEANLLLKAYHENKESQHEQDMKEVRKIEGRRWRIERRRTGTCTYTPGCYQPAVKGIVYCRVHRAQSIETQRRYVRRKKEATA